MDWHEWLEAFDTAVESAGYEYRSALPVYDFVSSEGSDAEMIDDAIYDMWKEGLSPEAAVKQTEDRDAFWEKYIPRGSMMGRDVGR